MDKASTSRYRSWNKWRAAAGRRSSRMTGSLLRKSADSGMEDGPAVCSRPDECTSQDSKMATLKSSLHHSLSAVHFE